MAKTPNTSEEKLQAEVIAKLVSKTETKTRSAIDKAIQEIKKDSAASTEVALNKVVVDAAAAVVGVPQILKDYLASYGETIKTANRTWSVLAILIVFVLAQNLAASDGLNLPKKLPFDLGEVSSELFGPLALILLNVVFIYYAQLRAQAKIIYDRCRQMAQDRKTDPNFNQQHVSLLLYSSINRIMPLVNLSDTNYGTKNDRSDFALAYYLLIRIGAVITLLGLPVSTIVILWFDVWNNFQLLNFNSWMFGLSPIALLSSLVTLFAALQLLWEDWKQTQKIFKNKRPDESVPDKV